MVTELLRFWIGTLEQSAPGDSTLSMLQAVPHSQSENMQHCQLAPARAWHANEVAEGTHVRMSTYARIHLYCTLSKSLCSLASNPFASMRCRLLCKASRNAAPADTHLPCHGCLLHAGCKSSSHVTVYILAGA